MLFNSYTYLLFLAVACCLYWLVRPGYRAGVLILLGLAFYSYQNPAHVLLILGMSVFTYAAGHAIMASPHGRRRTLLYALTCILLCFVVFKYLRLLLATYSSLTGVPVTPVSLAMPLGISFFTFEFIHYLTDIRRGKIGPHRASDFFGFILFFPTMVAGPIKRFQGFAASLHETRFSPAAFWTGVLLLLLGYSQKYLLADPLIPFTAELQHPHVILTRMSAVGGLTLYSFRIYFDFAGLSNIAVGSSLLLGVVVPRNFSMPYLSTDIQDFWRRWHMSLGSWVRDYIYISLGGNRRGFAATLFFLFLSMVIVGIWHGASWNFAAWGAYHGLGLAVHRVWKRHVPDTRSRVRSVLGCAATFVFVTIGWGFFVTSSLHDSLILFAKIFS